MGPGPLVPVEGQGEPQELEGLGDRVAMLVHVDLHDLLFVGGGLPNHACYI